MNTVPSELYPRSDLDKHLGVSYEERWQRLKPVIVQLYSGNYGRAGKTTTLTQLADFMKQNYVFYATPKQYRTHFDAWGIKKNVGKEKKDDAILALTKRKRPGASTSHVTVAEGGEDKQLPPAKIMRHIKEQKRRLPIERLTPGLLSSWNLPYEAFIASIYQDPDKPSPFGPQTSTPEGLKIESPKPTTPGHDTAGPSPNMQLVYQKAKENRATLFLQGRLEELIISMGREDRKLFVNYFHDFYIEAFSQARQSPHRMHVLEVPTQLCNWAIHVPSTSGDAKIKGSLPQPPEQPREQTINTPFPQALRQTMLSSSFTSVLPQDLPFARNTIVNAINDDPEALELDAWKLAIMAGNHKLLYDLYDQRPGEVPQGLDDIYPLHLAAAFLDGGNVCCKMFEELFSILGPEYAFRHNVDELGHTLLDALMTSVLRSHTVVNPGFVNKAFNPAGRFPGEEIDICGRWNPNSPGVRSLFHGGSPRIPEKWKHPFCHTAVQAVCHNINISSGLFIRRCTECGLELKLGPLHTLVVVTFCLAQYGMLGETLFGAIALLVCLLSLGADVNLKANICAEEILGNSEAPGCRHTSISPSELMERVPDHLQRHGTDMGLLWATIQTEMLTYRRINEGDSWISDNFPLIALEAWLSGHSADFATPLVTNQMMNGYSKCGWFHEAEAFVLPAGREASKYYFMNMDDYARTTYLDNSDIMILWEDIKFELESDEEDIV
ncbi:hypothetical protein GGR51DRAFT_546759 [Nemania sp. FL0031]|nr:hypothetical protein GGR51DRAFT_546759 [Nemania sp. FL0031]